MTTRYRIMIFISRYLSIVPKGWQDAEVGELQ
jgi:hypothetical protein